MTAPFLTIDETAEALRVSPRTIHNWLVADPPVIDPVYVRRHGNVVRIHRSYVDPSLPQPSRNVRPFPSTLSDDQLDAALDRALARLLSRVAYPIQKAG